MAIQSAEAQTSTLAKLAPLHTAAHKLSQPARMQESCHARRGGLTEGHEHSMELRPSRVPSGAKFSVSPSLTRGFRLQSHLVPSPVARRVRFLRSDLTARRALGQIPA